MAEHGLSSPKFGYVAASRLFLILALLSLIIADLTITGLDPWAELRRLLAGLLRPDLLSVEIKSIVWTVAFAVLRGTQHDHTGCYGRGVAVGIAPAPRPCASDAPTGERRRWG